MRNPLTLAVAALGATGVAYRLLQRRRAAPGRDPVPADPRAQELRRKLDESRELVEERDEFEAREIPVDQAEPPSACVEERRRDVHESGRAAVEAMRDSLSRE